VKLSDVMSAMQLAHYAEVALLIFFAVFVGVVVHVLRRGLFEQWERARYLPLEDGPERMNPEKRGIDHG